MCSSDLDAAVGYLEARIHRYAASTRGLQILALNDTPRDMTLTGSEQKIVDLLADRPFSIDELLEHTGAMIESSLPLQRLEEYAVVQRCGLTPSDLLHVTGRFDRWDGLTAVRYAAIYAATVHQAPSEMAEAMLEKVVRDLALELLKRELDGETDPEALHTCPVCRTLVENMFSGGSNHYRDRKSVV